MAKTKLVTGFLVCPGVGNSSPGVLRIEFLDLHAYILPKSHFRYLNPSVDLGLSRPHGSLNYSSAVSNIMCFIVKIIP